ncbi:hypothetical protein BSEG_04624, partial [Phocaeicola dorei 5_1_36/D4]
YIFSGDDFSLNVNDPQNPIVLTVGSYPTLTQTFAPLCSLVITVATKLMNQPAKAPSFVLLDEAPTIFVPNLEVLPNTGRSNKVATVLMCQDLAQLTDGYGSPFRKLSDSSYAVLQSPLVRHNRRPNTSPCLRLFHPAVLQSLWNHALLPTWYHKKV